MNTVPRAVSKANSVATTASFAAVDSDSASWATRRFRDLAPSDLGVSVAFFSAAGLPAPPGFEGCWHTFCGDAPDCSVSSSFPKICNASTTLVFLADPASATEEARLHRFVEVVDDFDAPPLLWVPHSVAPELRGKPSAAELRLVIQDVLEDGLDNILNGEPEGWDLALQMRAAISKNNSDCSRWHKTKEECQKMRQHAEYLKTCNDHILWEYFRSRKAKSIPAIDTQLPDGLAKIVDGYHLGKLIGEGSFGQVYLASKPGAMQQEVFKVVSKTCITSIEQLKATARQIDIMKLLSSDNFGHPNITELHAVCHSSTHLYFRMEFGGACNLFQRLIQRDDDKLALTALQHYSIVMQVIEAVTHLHLKPSVCHRDIKPENIVLNEMGNNLVVKLTDFDMAAHMPRQGARSRTACGTYPFVAPEVLLEEEHSGFVADVWALGVVLFEVLGKVGGFQKIYRLPKPKGCPREAEMQRVKLAVQGRVASDALSAVVNDSCKELLSNCSTLFDGMIEVDATRRLRAEDLKAQARKLPAAL